MGFARRGKSDRNRIARHAIRGARLEPRSRHLHAALRNDSIADRRVATQLQSYQENVKKELLKQHTPDVVRTGEDLSTNEHETKADFKIGGVNNFV